ncbi:MAG TPA: mechanosensitive ion channel domain-containing protein [Patescibacteria group bacterium]|nr:mechanosensitive ion channel domain-containing protein [Patescibacteria group bacterium]
MTTADQTTAATIAPTQPVHFVMTPASWLWIAIGLAAIVGFYALKKSLYRKAQEKSEFFILLYHRLKRPAEVTLVATALFIILQQFPVTVTLRDEVWFHKTYALLIIALLTWVCIELVFVGTEIITRKLDLSISDNREARRIYTKVSFASRAAVSVFILIGIASGLMMFDQIRSLGVSLIASAGVAGVVLGFAAQKTMGTFFTGLQIAMTQPVSIGDAVLVENEWGTIEEINLSYVVVKIWDLRRLVLPITYFVDKPFQNWTRTSAAIMGTVMLYLDYTMPIEPIRQELDRILAETKLWNGDVKGVQVTDFRERTMEVRILVSADDSSKAWDLRCLIREKIMAFLTEHYLEKLPCVRASVVEESGESAAEPHEIASTAQETYTSQ